jgi:hypothetical protein
MIDYLSVVCNTGEPEYGQGSSALPMLQAVGVASLFTIPSEHTQQTEAREKILTFNAGVHIYLVHEHS